MSTLASQITGISIVCWTVCSGSDLRKHQSSVSLALPVTGGFSSQWANNAENVSRNPFTYQVQWLISYYETEKQMFINSLTIHYIRWLCASHLKIYLLYHYQNVFHICCTLNLCNPCYNARCEMRHDLHRKIISSWRFAFINYIIICSVDTSLLDIIWVAVIFIQRYPHFPDIFFLWWL